MSRTVSLSTPAMTAVGEPRAAPDWHRFGDDTHVGGRLDAADAPCRDVGLQDADIGTGRTDKPVQVADADCIAVKEGVSSHAEVGQLLRDVRAEAAEPDQDDARGCQPLLSRVTEQRDLAGVPLAQVCSAPGLERIAAHAGLGPPAFTGRAKAPGRFATGGSPGRVLI